MRTFAQKPDLPPRQASSRAAQPDLGQASLPPIVRDVLTSPGQPLDAVTRSFMEPRFGHDFSQVRIHASSGATASAAAVHAQAYTVGQHIVLGAGNPSPESFPGRLLLAHELAHVVQQRGGRGAAPEISPTAHHEADARAAAKAVVTGRTGVRVASRTGIGLARQENLLESVVSVAGDLVEETTGVRPTSVGELEEGLRSIGESGGKHADSANRLLGEIDQVAGVADRQGHLQQAQREAGELLRSRRGGWLPRRGNRIGNIIEELERAARERGPDAARARVLVERIRRLRERVGKLEEARRATQMFQAPGNVQQKVKSTPKSEPKVPAKLTTPAKTVPAAGAPAATAGAKVESAAADVASMGAKSVPQVGSKLAKVGSLGLNLLLPGPLDAIALMVQFAGSYAEAQEAIRNRNTRTGFALGLSGALMGRAHEAVRKRFWRNVVLDREVHTQIVGAVGIAEKSHNAGLDSGFHYGEQLSDEAKDALLDIGLSILLKQGRLPATKDDLYTADGVARLAGALLPTVDQIFEAMRVQAEKQREQEREEKWRKRRQESWSHGTKI
jgi:hypothetical protein